METREPPRLFYPLTRAEMRTRLHIAVVIHLRWLPQLKGKGASKDRQHNDVMTAEFIDRVLESMFTRNDVWLIPAQWSDQHHVEITDRKVPDGPG